MSSDKMYDELLYPILCSEGNIFGFFDRIFEFLYRRTDFFKLKGVESPELGLDNGEAEKIVRSIFCKYMEQASLERKQQTISEIETVPLDYAVEETVVTTESVEETVVTTESQLDTATKSLEVSDLSEINVEDAAQKQDDQLEARVPVMDSDSYNGASYEGYSWSQSIRDADIRVKVPSEVSSGKSVRVTIQQTHLKVEVCSENQWTVLKEGDFSWLVNVEESTWTLVPHEHIHVCLQKMQERWWDSFFVGEPKINLKAIDPSIAYEELDTDSQTKIQELMYNEHMKRLGKPSIQQSKIQNILKEAWDQEGSPFKGQPFDPSIVNIQNS